jgi:hypothetical protein
MGPQITRALEVQNPFFRHLFRQFTRNAYIEMQSDFPNQNILQPRNDQRPKQVKNSKLQLQLFHSKPTF